MDWTPEEVGALRISLRMSLDEFASHLGASTKSVRNWEQGTHQPVPASQRLLDSAHDRLTPRQRTRLDELLSPVPEVLIPQPVSGATVAAAIEHEPPTTSTPLALTNSHGAPSPLTEVDFDDLAQALIDWAGSSPARMSRREALSRLSTALALAAVGPGLAVDDPDSAQRLASVLRNPERVDAASLKYTETIILSCRRQGDILGPEIALQTSLAQRQLTESMLAATPSPLRSHALSLYAELTQLAGWSLFNLGRYREAQRFYDEARVIAHEAENSDLVTYILCAMSQLVTWQGRPRVGIDHAAGAAAWAATPHARAYSADVAVKAYAAAGQREKSREALDHEQRAVTLIANEATPSPWWYFYDESFSLQTEALHALRFNDPIRAQRSVDRSLALIDSTNLHNVSFNLLYRCEAFIQQREPLEASRTLSDVAELACTGTSLRLQQRVLNARRSLSPWDSLEPVQALDDRMRQLAKLSAAGAQSGGNW